MTKILYYLFPLLLLHSFQLLAQEDAVMNFQKTEHDFGMVKELGGKVSATFTFTNAGTKPLIISSINVSCGCTAPTYSKEPVLPGKTGQVTLTFDPNGRVGKFVKSATVNHNGTPGITVLMISGEVYQGEVHEEHREFVQNFEYNKKTVVLGDPSFEAFLKEIKPILEKNHKLTVTIESSSSRVPTKLYKSNLELTKARAADAKKQMKKLMKKLDINEDVVFFTEPVLLIQGPEYADDWRDNEKVYEQYQYVKIVVQ